MSYATAAGKYKSKTWYPKGKVSSMHDGPRNDQLFAMVMALAVEVSVLRERLDTHERVSEDNGRLTNKDVEDFNADESVLNFRSGLRARIFHKVFRVLREETARLEAGDQDNYDEIMKEFDSI